MTARRILGAAAGLALAGMVVGRAEAAQTDVVISMAPAPAAPRILGPGIVGIVTGTPFLYRVPATGQRPMTFAATGLPVGLAIDAATGRITGTASEAGPHTITVTATNAAGSAHRDVVVRAGDTLALTPPMGWNSYDSFDDAVTEADMLAQAQALVDRLQPYGWDTVVVDYRWYDPGAPGTNQNQAAINEALVMDANGRLQPTTMRFPSATNGTGFTSLAARIHALGLKFGIHIMRGIPRRAYRDSLPIAGLAPGTTFTGRDAANVADTSTWNSDMYGVRGDTAAGQAWYDSIFRQYADWGIDFVKVDDITRNVAPIQYHAAEVVAIRTAIARTGRSIVLSLSPGETPIANAADVGMNANMWRMSNDFWDRAVNLDFAFTLADRWRVFQGPPGHWPDEDMLPLGFLGPICPVDGNHNTRFTRNEQVTMMSLWALLPSPLMLGANIVQSTDAFTTALLTNEDMLLVNQDALGARATRAVQQGTTEVWAKQLSGGRLAVGLFNRGAADAPVAVTWAQLGLSGTRLVRDVWGRIDLPPADSMVSAAVPWRGAALFVLAPPPVSGTDGGAGAGGGTSGSGGAPGTGGGGAGGEAGGMTGGEGGAGTSGTGTGGAAGGTGTPPAPTPGSGCSCALGTGGGGLAALLAASAAVGVARRRRRLRR